MHRSRLAGLIIDCETDDLDAATHFWSHALGLSNRASDAPEDAGYAVLANAPGDLHVELQRVSHPSRVHLDIATDNVEAEVARLEALGAQRVKAVRDWWVMQAPSGHRFCVIHSDDMGVEANTWPGEPGA